MIQNVAEILCDVLFGVRFLNLSGWCIIEVAKQAIVFGRIGLCASLNLYNNWKRRNGNWRNLVILYVAVPSRSGSISVIFELDCWTWLLFLVLLLVASGMVFSEIWVLSLKIDGSVRALLSLFNYYIIVCSLTAWLSLSDRFPVINSLMQKINLRKRRDAIIVGLVAGGCVILLLWYAVLR